jgi:hypothetical protein
LQEEIFGPSMLLVRCGSPGDMIGAAEALEGHLTATIIGTEADLSVNQDLVSILERKGGCCSTDFPRELRLRRLWCMENHSLRPRTAVKPVLARRRFCNSYARGAIRTFRRPHSQTLCGTKIPWVSCGWSTANSVAIGFGREAFSNARHPPANVMFPLGAS